MKAAILHAPNQMRLATVADPVTGRGDLVLRVAAATVCGTDIRVFRGRKTAGIRYPSTIGHEFSGEIVATDGPSPFSVGQRVGVCPAIPCGHCSQCLRGLENLCPDLQAIGYEIDGAFAEYIRIPARAVELGNVHVLPDHVGYEAAALIEPLACVLNGQNKVGLSQGDTVAILGAGPIGTLHVKLARLRGAARVIVSEPNAARRAAALQAGADVVLDPTTGDLRAAIRNETRGQGADVVICAIGIPALASQAVGLAAKGGRVSLFAGFSKGETGTLDVNAIHYDELQLTGAFGLTRHDYEVTLHMIADGRIDLSDMVTHRFGLTDIEQAFAVAESGAAMKVAVCNG
ncbi:zinc-dependent dehydrogenase [Paragemmobacter straminiformis]|uniref:Alcohol dehydrogenase catalytic domain-containing protein n=1 Tax=Paragemmobacter straminiformis TaxID=2045119 RepID=A0A842IDD3_9RHOB|nr:zinc-dependent dehydrogenase [Gemmobacter straminiformis]MBC2837591.1 alcohol dehydrogenase catalytic domain-containing protein [Gemmobacter straminiformis]